VKLEKFEFIIWNNQASFHSNMNVNVTFLIFRWSNQKKRHYYLLFSSSHHFTLYSTNYFSSDIKLIIKNEKSTLLVKNLSHFQILIQQAWKTEIIYSENIDLLDLIDQKIMIMKNQILKMMKKETIRLLNFPNHCNQLLS
jgi:hypothetical protein